MMKVKKFFILIVVGHVLAGCASLLGQKSVSQVLNNKNNYLGQEFTVSGILSITSQGIVICESELLEECMNLELLREMFDDLKAMSGSQISVRGTYEHHEFRDLGEETIFYPSRFVVSELISSHP